MSLRLVQLSHPERGRAVAIVEEPRLRLITGGTSIYELALAAINAKQKLAAFAGARADDATLEYDPIYTGRSEWMLIRPFDHPQAAHRCLVTGTGLTHKASAQSRQSMHDTGVESDSMKMYRIGLEGGRPAAGQIGAEPEWFYKGTGAIIRSPGEAMGVPAHALDGGEEAEIAGAYVIGADGQPYRIGLLQGNEFSDHVLETKNYLYLASSKLRFCSIGPELVVDADFSDVPGQSWIERRGEKIWQAGQHSGEKWMSHTLANLEHHHFKHGMHRIPGDAHIHFFGADNFSFKDRVKLQDGDEMVIAFSGFGRPLRNPIRIESSPPRCVTVNVL
jgi:hypothetical protein